MKRYVLFNFYEQDHNRLHTDLIDRLKEKTIGGSEGKPQTPHSNVGHYLKDVGASARSKDIIIGDELVISVADVKELNYTTNYVNVYEDSLKDKANAFKLTSKIFYGQQMIALLKERCTEADKIYIAAHGGIYNKDYVSMNSNQRHYMRAHLDVMTDPIAKCLSPDKKHKIGLIICFGARSEDYNKNHDDALTSDDLKSSIAYNIIKLLCEKSKAPITLSARYGIVKFPMSGSDHKLLSGTEVSSAAYAELQYLKSIFNDKIFDTQELEALNKFKMNYYEVVDSIKDKKHDLYPKEMVNIFMHKNKIEELHEISASESNFDRKYGKLVYVSDDAQTIRIYRKYQPDPEKKKIYASLKQDQGGQTKSTMELLYEGML